MSGVSSNCDTASINFSWVVTSSRSLQVGNSHLPSDPKSLLSLSLNVSSIICLHDSTRASSRRPETTTYPLSCHCVTCSLLNGPWISFIYYLCYFIRELSRLHWWNISIFFLAVIIVSLIFILRLVKVCITW